MDGDSGGRSAPGTLCRLVQGVYADPALDVDHRLRACGVALLLPAGTAIGGHSAAAWHGAPLAGVHEAVTVVRPSDVERKGPRQVRVHRTDLASTDVELVDDVPVTTALRTAWDAAALEPRSAPLWPPSTPWSEPSPSVFPSSCSWPTAGPGGGA